MISVNSLSIGRKLRDLLIHYGFMRPRPGILKSGIRPGPVALVGQLECEELLCSPIKHRMCCAYHYRAWGLASRRRTPWKKRRLIDVIAYAKGLRIRLSDGDVKLDTPAPEVDEAGFRNLRARKYEGFKEREWRIMPGQNVVVHGRARRGADGEWNITNVSLEASK